jgi:hypothetical protein
VALIRPYWDEDAKRHGGAAFFVNDPETVANEPGRHELCLLIRYRGGDPVPPILFSFAGSGAELHIVGARVGPDARVRSCAALRGIAQ